MDVQTVLNMDQGEFSDEEVIIELLYFKLELCKERSISYTLQFYGQGVLTIYQNICQPSEMISVRMVKTSSNDDAKGLSSKSGT